MTLSTTTVRNSYISTGTVGPYTYTYRITTASDLVVTSTGATTDAVTTYVYPSDYTVSGAGNAAGGAVTFAVAVPAGDTVDIVRAVPATQPTSLRTLGRFAPEVHEEAFDRLTMLVQQLLRRITALENGDTPVEGAAAFTQLDVTPGTTALEDLIASRGTFSGAVQVSVSGKTAKVQGVGAAGALVDGGWVTGHTDGLNLTPNDDGIAGEKLVLGYFDGTGLYRSAIEYANTVSGLTTITITPTTNFSNSIAVSVMATVSALRISGGPSSPASSSTGTTGEVRWDTGFVYICTATNTWKRAALTGGY